MPINVGIVEAQTQLSRELVRRLERHPDVQITALQAANPTARTLGEAFGEFRGRKNLPEIRELDVAVLRETCSAVFLCNRNGVSMDLVPQLLDGNVRVFDLASDFRFRDRESYARAYGQAHPRQELNMQAVYGLPEVYRISIAGAKLVAVPGSYPTAVLLALAPLMKHDVLEDSPIIADCKGGLTVGGSHSVESMQFITAQSDVFPFFPAAAQHNRPEIEEQLRRLSAQTKRVTFVPHVVPMARGILATCYCELAEKTDAATILKLYQDFYAGERFVRLLGENEVPHTESVVGTNYCDIGLRVDVETQRLIIISAIDNLTKGGAGLALQCFNISYGLNEDAGLR